MNVQQSTTPAPTVQAAQFPTVSYRLMVRVTARKDAMRHGVPPGPAIEAADQAYRATGNRFQAKRAAWATVDAQVGRGAQP